MKPIWLALLVFLAAISGFCAENKATAVIRADCTNKQRIDPKLFGNFIELLDDVAPAMWAEMLNDRSFEGITKLADWCYYDGSPDFCDREWDRNATWNYDTENPFNGKRSAKLTCAPQHSASLTQSGLAVKKGMTYIFSGYLRADNTKVTVRIVLKARLPTGDWMTLASAKLPALSSEWKIHSACMDSKSETDRMVFELQAEGEGYVWVDKVSLMPADNMKGWRREVVESVKDVRPGLVRFGGSVVDPGGYRWKDGVGNRNFRVPFPNKVWGRLDSNDVGMDEFCQFCELIRAEPLVCVSFSDGAQSAADLVEYCNGDAGTSWGGKRKANGHPAPYRVKYWQIGNEISGDNEDYLNHFGQFVAQMKKVDPNILIVSSFPSQKLLDRAGPLIDFIAPHHYTSDLVSCDREMERLTQMIDHTAGCARIQIAVTEWNTSGGDWGLLRGKQQTLENAIINARYLHVLMRYAGKVKIACRSNMANSFCGAIIETSPAGLLKRPSYYAMQLYARHALPVPVKVEQSTNGPDVFACASEDGKSASIFAINPTREPIEWSCRLEGFEAALHASEAEVMCDTLDRKQPDAMNHWQSPARIRIVPLKISEGAILLPALSVTAIAYGTNLERRK